MLFYNISFLFNKRNGGSHKKSSHKSMTTPFSKNSIIFSDDYYWISIASPKEKNR